MTGNAEIGTYESIQKLSSGLVDVNGKTVVSYAPSGLPVTDLRWEETAQFDIGIDLGLFKNRLRFTTDYYDKRTNDLLVDLPLPLSSGIGNITKNVGSISNKGFEFLVDAVISDNEFKWNVNANLSFNKSEVLDLGSISEFFIGSAYRFSNLFLLNVGEAVGNFYGFKYDGVYKSTDEVLTGYTPGSKKYRDISGPDGNPDGTINDLDKTVIGNSNPDFIYGVTNSFSYKGFDFSFLLQGVNGNDILNCNKVSGLSLNGATNNFKEVVNRWTPSNENTNIPKANSKSYPILFSNEYLEDGSYLRVKNIKFGYNFKGLNHINNLGIFVSANNLLTFTKYSGYDPEVNFYGQSNLLNGVDWGTYPRSKSITFGINIGL